MDAFNEACRAGVLAYTDEWRNATSAAMARWVDFEHEYKTMDLDLHGEPCGGCSSRCFDKGLIYEGLPRASPTARRWPAPVQFRGDTETTRIGRIASVDRGDSRWTRPVSHAAHGGVGGRQAPGMDDDAVDAARQHGHRRASGLDYHPASASSAGSTDGRARRTAYFPEESKHAKKGARSGGGRRSIRSEAGAEILETRKATRLAGRVPAAVRVLRRTPTLRHRADVQVLDGGLRQRRGRHWRRAHRALFRRGGLPARPGGGLGLFASPVTLDGKFTEPPGPGVGGRGRAKDADKAHHPPAQEPTASSSGTRPTAHPLSALLAHGRAAPLPRPEELVPGARHVRSPPPRRDQDR